MGKVAIRKKKVAKLKHTRDRMAKAAKAKLDVVEAPKVERGHKNKAIRKWLYQCAYWKICNSCALKESCRAEMKKQGIDKNWIHEQISGLPPK
ncbi:MAG: hypothetical protein WC607_01115 [Candidatus Micrarchaeia archaeon]